MDIVPDNQLYQMWKDHESAITTLLKLEVWNDQYWITSSSLITSYWIAKVHGSTIIGNHCVVGAACSTEINETIEDMTIIYGTKSCRRKQSEVFPVSLVVLLSCSLSNSLTAGCL